MASLEPTLIFIPGIGADPRLFKYQTAVFPNSFAVDWIDPQNGETLEQYAERLAETIRTELEKRPPALVVVCGLSLGGMIAPYIARHLNAAGNFAILHPPETGLEIFLRKCYATPC